MEGDNAATSFLILPYSLFSAPIPELCFGGCTLFSESLEFPVALKKKPKTNKNKNQPSKNKHKQSLPQPNKTKLPKKKKKP